MFLESYVLYQYVEIQKEEQIEKREIKTGLSDGFQMEVIEGLKVGDRIIERPPREIK